MSVEQAVNTAIDLCLVGKGVWDDDAVDLPGLLRGIIRSITTAERRKYARAKILTSSDAVEQYEGIADSAEESLIKEESRAELIDGVQACTSDDDDLGMLFLAILDGAIRRDEIAATLDWTPERVTAARIKLQRRLVRFAPQKFATAHARHRRSS